MSRHSFAAAPPHTKMHTTCTHTHHVWHKLQPLLVWSDAQQVVALAAHDMETVSDLLGKVQLPERAQQTGQSAFKLRGCVHVIVCAQIARGNGQILVRPYWLLEKVWSPTRVAAKQDLADRTQPWQEHHLAPSS